MAVTPNVDTGSLPRVTLNVSGQSLTQLPIVAMTVHREINRIPWAEIVLVDGDAATGSFALSDAATFEPGAEVTINAGYGNSDAPLFTGLVVRHRLKLDGENSSRLMIECRDKAPESARADAESGPAALSVAWGADLLSFEAELDSKAAPVRTRGRMRFHGNAAAMPGRRIAVSGVGARFSGSINVSAVEHVFSNGDWTTQVEFGPPPDRTDPAFGG